MGRKLPIERLEAKFPSMPRPQSRYLSRIPALMLFSGHTGSGKSVNAISLIQYLKREGTCTRCFVISPTVVSNQIYKSICTDPERDWLIPLTEQVFDDLRRIEAACEADAENFRKDLEYQLARQKYCDGSTLTQQEEILLEQRQFVEVKPVRPSPLLLVDDCVSSKMFSNSSRNYFTQLCVRCRHVGQQLGLSIFACTQSIKLVPRSIRLNATHWCVWATSSKIERTILFEEVGSAFMSQEEFFSTFELMTALPYSYCFIDCITRSISDSW